MARPTADVGADGLRFLLAVAPSASCDRASYRSGRLPVLGWRVPCVLAFFSCGCRHGYCAFWAVAPVLHVAVFALLWYLYLRCNILPACATPKWKVPAVALRSSLSSRSLVVVPESSAEVGASVAKAPSTTC